MEKEEEEEKNPAMRPPAEFQAEGTESIKLPKQARAWHRGQQRQGRERYLMKLRVRWAAQVGPSDSGRVWILI